jgi:hypothetical protein
MECRSCDTLLVRVEGRVKRAAGYEGHLPADRDTVALVCRFCAGALPDEVLRQGTGARCVYCGERADLPPTVRAALRVMFTRPTALPRSLKVLAHIYLGLVAAFVAVVIAYAAMPRLYVHVDERVALSPTAERREGDTRVYELQARSETVRVHARGNAMPYVTLAAWKFDGQNTVSTIPGARLQVLVTAVREEDGARRSQWLVFDDAGPEDTRKIYDNFRFDGYSPTPLLPGRYHFELTQARLLGERGQLPLDLELQWRTAPETLHGWFILLANLLIWSFIWDTRRWADTGEPRRYALNWRRAILLALLAWLAYITLTAAQPGAAPGKFEARAAPAPPPW